MDKRPRFGWTETLDNEPQVIREGRKGKTKDFPVAVIPLPFMSAKMRTKILAFTKQINGD
jgi:hypothetical protein